MKKVFPILLLLMVAMMTACYDTGNWGYPEKVQFNANGGSKTIYGDRSLYADVSVYEPNDATEHNDWDIDTSSVHRDTFYIHHKWLTVRWTDGERSLTITTEPNSTWKKGDMWMRLGMGRKPDAEVSVYQSAY